MRRIVLLVASAAVAMVVLGGVAWAATIQCPTGRFNGIGLQCWGTPKADTTRGTDKVDVISGNEGNDTIYGRRANDGLFGNDGSDKIYGQRGADVIYGKLGSDRIYGGPGTDRMTGSFSDLSDTADASDDYVHGGADGDSLTGGGLSGVDYLYGEDGNDIIYVTQRRSPHNLVVSKEIVDCGPGTDEVSFDQGVDVVLDNCEIKHPFKMR